MLIVSCRSIISPPFFLFLPQISNQFYFTMPQPVRQSWELIEPVLICTIEDWAVHNSQ